MNHALILNVHQMGISRPSGAHRIASYLRENSWDVEVIDYVNDMTYEVLEEIIRMRITTKTVFVGFSCYFSHWTDNTEKLSGWIKSTYPNIKIVYGGQSKSQFNCKNIDYYIHGYGEKAITALTSSLLESNGVGSVAFDPLYFGQKKVISANESYPSYPMTSLRISYEDRDHIRPYEWLSVEFGRGCKFECPFCNYPILGVKSDHTRSAEDFEIEMRENYERWGVKHYYVADETFNDSSEKIIKFSEVIKKLNFQPYFVGYIRPDLLVARHQDWEPMAQLGFFGQYYGIESFNHPTMKIIGKGMHPDRLQDGLLQAREYFRGQGLYRGTISLMVGLPYETSDTLEKTFNWIENNWQRENACCFPLEIPVDPKFDILSKMSKDYGGYGYRMANQQVDTQELDEFYQVRIQHGITNIIWENDHMNYIEAIKIAGEFKSRYLMNPEKSNFAMMWTLGAHASSLYSLKHVIESKKESSPYPRGWHQRHIENYINKKITSVEKSG